jgi:hypothetical protein
VKKSKIIILTAIFICVVTISFLITKNSAVAGAMGKQVQSGTPKADVPQKKFTFSEVLEGEVVTHAYVIKNQGTASLKVLGVRTSCGCTTAQRPETIAPGAQDQVVVKGNTSGYGGRNFHKTITVSTNDPDQPRIELQLSGPVVQFARIEPGHIVLRGRKDETLQTEATITPNPKYPFHISSTETDNKLADKIDVRMEQREGAYHIIVSNRESNPGNYWGRILFKTDSTTRPMLTLYVRGFIME